ncbi:von Willebrand factor type A domain protein [Ancylostoma duodenale]|uniref:von Willebrand factor type A domain protein n=1 Tax=Ancylostoma duodenale TaxID=51022 RepID=A0A0C2E2C5_9BILA|nr:von Willebrand factor type A domain protein [Ancylostoma duodenale]
MERIALDSVDLGPVSDNNLNPSIMFLLMMRSGQYTSSLPIFNSKRTVEDNVACPADVLFVLDATGSMKDVFDDSLNYITKVLQGLTISPNADRVGVIVYSSSTKQKEKIPLGSINDPAELTKAIQGLPFLSGTTATGAALGFAEQALRNRRADVHTTVVVITDGFSYDSPDRYAAKLRNHPNTIVLAVSMGHPCKSDIHRRKVLILMNRPGCGKPPQDVGILAAR